MVWLTMKRNGRAGALDQRVTFQAKTFADDGGGGSTATWANVPSVPTVWAAAEAMRSIESITEGRVNASGLYSFTVRYRTDIDETCRILWNSEAFNIVDVKRSSGRELYLVIQAERGELQ